jgi:hypothetical protein
MRSRALPPILLLLLSLATVGQERDYAPLARKTEALRGLTFKRPVPTLVVDGPALKRVLEAQIKKEYPDSLWPEVEKTLKAFSLIPPKMNLKGVMTALLDEQVVGLYDPDAKKLYVSSAPAADAELLGSLGVEGFDLRDVYVLHEMVHALTDQAFDMKSLPLDDRENEDRASAARCVVEGDATWVMLRYMYDALKIPAEQRGQIDDVMFGMNLGKEMLGTSTPAYLQENLLMAYLGGQALVKMAYERGGFDAVNRLYRSPPQSMEQVLHPEKFFAGKDPPVAVPLPAMTAFSAEGWRSVSTGVWGELNAKIILQEWGVPEEQARATAEGWGGDAYRVAEGPGGALGFAWTTVWDTDRDAAEFFQACAGLKGLSASREGKKVTVLKGAAALPAQEKLKQAS